jgi:hypothetical protein
LGEGWRGGWITQKKYSVFFQKKSVFEAEKEGFSGKMAEA